MYPLSSNRFKHIDIMAKEIENININGEAYEVGKIYAKMGLSFERFVELLERDFYCPTLASDPTSSTTTYTDTDGESHTFQKGQFAMVASSSAPHGYKVWQCLQNNGTSAVWSCDYDTMTAYVAERLTGKQDKVLKFEGKTASSWVSDSAYADYPYRCDVSCSGVTADMYAEVVFGVEHSTSGNYAPVCETKNGVVSIWSKENTTITIPTIIITK